jgi:hypothetical protein
MYESEKLINKDMSFIQCFELNIHVVRLINNYQFSIKKGFHKLSIARLLMMSDDLCDTNNTKDILLYVKGSLRYNPVWAESLAFFTVYEFSLNDNIEKLNFNLKKALIYGRYEKIVQLTLIPTIIENWGLLTLSNKKLSLMLFKHVLKFEYAPYLIDFSYKNCFIKEILGLSANPHQLNRMTLLLSKIKC